MIKKEIEKIAKECELKGYALVTYDEGCYTSFYGGFATESKKTDKNTIYRIASISKIIVALGIMKLWEEGKVSLDEDISTYLGFEIRNPNFKNTPITLRMLMTQTSSITDGFDDEEMTNETRIDGYNGVNGTNLKVSLEDLLVPNNTPYYSTLTYANYKPGSEFCYSNFGCGILACIIEKVSNENYNEYIRKNIFEPLNINASFIPSILKLARYHNGEGFIASTYTNGVLTRSEGLFLKNEYPIFPCGTSFRGPAGGCFINAEDLARLMGMLIENGGVILKMQTIKEMEKINWQISEERRLSDLNRYGSYNAKGLQLAILNRDNHILYGHTGSAYGLRSIMMFDPVIKKGLVFLTNGGNYHTAPSGLTDCLEKVLSLWESENYEK